MVSAKVCSTFGGGAHRTNQVSGIPLFQKLLSSLKGMVFDCHGRLPLKAKVMNNIYCISNSTPLSLHQKLEPHKKQEPQTPPAPHLPYVLERFSPNNHHPPPGFVAMRATLPSRFALALDARAPRRSLNGASAAPGPPVAGPAVPVTSAPTASSASVTSSGPIGQALLEKVGIQGGCHWTSTA